MPSMYIIYSLLLWIIVSEGQNIHDTIVERRENAGFSYFYQQPEYPRDCQEVYAYCSSTNSSGVYLIKPDGFHDAFAVYCDNDIDGGGWTVFQRRTEGSINFNRTWEDYKNGFGFQHNEFWLGYEKLSFLTNQKKYEIRIDVTNVVNQSFYILYTAFRISDEHSGYRMSAFVHYSGTADNHILTCPANMEYGNCTHQATCEDPEILMADPGTCTEQETCICREGLLKKGEDCVPPSTCSCFFEGEGVISNGRSLVNVDCTRSCQCQSNILDCDDTYACSPSATCEERDGIRKCYCIDGYAGDGQTCEVIATDCADIYNGGITDSGVYNIKPTAWPGTPFEVYCNMTDGGGWTVFQRRMDGTEDFYRGWESYKDGFGAPNHELWLGNDKISNLTNQRSYQLRIDVVDRNGSPYYAKYDLFRINDINDNYRLTELGSFTGNAGSNMLNWHRNLQFSTYDMDNDGWSSYNCAERHHGGWWFKRGGTSSGNCITGERHCDTFTTGDNTCAWCREIHLNGGYISPSRGTDINWSGLSGYDCNIKYTEMKIKPL